MTNGDAMSVRRLAGEQPDSFEFDSLSEDKIAFWLSKYPDERKRSGVIPLLWIAQKQAGGWLPEAAMRAVAERLEMPYMRVYEVATFYTMFRLSPEGRHYVQVCGTTPCMLRGAEDLKTVCRERIGEQGVVSEDGAFSWLEVECLGACVNAPMVQISNADGDWYYEDLTMESFAELLDQLHADHPVEPGPRIDRQTSAPQGDATTLTDPSLFDGSRAKPAALPNLPSNDGQDADGGA